MSRFLAFVFAFLLVGLVSAGAELRAQQDPSAPAQSQQELATRKFAELTESMQRLHAYLAKIGEQDDIKVLRNGMTLVQQRRIDESMNSVKLMLDAERWDDSLKLMQDVRKDLVLLLDVLQNRNTDLQELLAQLARLEEYRKEVDRLAKEQADEKEASARAEALQKQLEDIAKAKDAAERLIAEQQQVRDSTNKLPLQAAAEATEPLANKEGELQKGAEKLATDIEDLEKKAEQLEKEQKDAEAKAAAAAKAAAKGDAEKKDPNAKPTDGKPSDAKPSDSKPNDAKPNDSKPSDAKPNDGKPSNTKSGGSCSSSAKSASKSMGKAQEQLGQKKPESSLKDQDQAVEQLKSTMKQLDEMAEAARRELERLPFDQQAKRQEQTQHATDTLAQKMEKSEQEGENAEGKPTPGQIGRAHV